MNYTVTPSLTGSLIHLETKLQMDGFADQIAHKMMDTEEAAVRAALIKLGWMPPPEPTTCYHFNWSYNRDMDQVCKDCGMVGKDVTCMVWASPSPPAPPSAPSAPSLVHRDPTPGV